MRPKQLKPEYYRNDGNLIAFAYDPFVKFLLFFVGGEGNLRTQTIDKLNLRPSEKVLDVCCGTGTLSRLAAERVGDKGKVIGVDLSANMLAKARIKGNHTNQKFILSNAERIDYPNDYFDKTYTSFCLHEIPYPVRINVIREIYQLLKKGGKILILDISYPENKLIKFLFHLYMIVEAKTAWDFLNQDLCLTLEESNFNSIKRETWCKGTIQVITGTK